MNMQPCPSSSPFSLFTLCFFPPSMAPVTLPPGFRFHPTDEELVAYYLDRKITGRPIELEIIPDVDLYKCEPWDLPDKSFLPSKDMEWYFFSLRDRKYPNGSRTNRATKAGYWKATGKDRTVKSRKRALGMKKTLVYYRGRAPHGIRTNWVMHEYRVIESESLLKDAYALCRIFKKLACRQKPEAGSQGGSPGDESQWKQDDYLSGNGVQQREDGAEKYERDDSRFPSDTCSSEVTEGSPTENGVVYHQQWSMSATEEGDSSTNASPVRVDSVSVPAMDRVMADCTVLQHLCPYPPLPVEDFPQIYTIGVEYLMNDKQIYFLTEANPLDEILYGASFSHDNSAALLSKGSSHSTYSSLLNESTLQ